MVTSDGHGNTYTQSLKNKFCIALIGLITQCIDEQVYYGKIILRNHRNTIQVDFGIGRLDKNVYVDACYQTFLLEVISQVTI